MVQIEWCWFHSKIFIFGQVMAKNGAHAHIWAYVFWPIWVNWAENFYGNSGDYYLSIGGEKSKLWCLFFSFDFLATFGGKMGVATTRALNGLGPPNPTKKLGHWVGQPLSWNHFFEISRGEPPPLNEAAKIAIFPELLYLRTHIWSLSALRQQKTLNWAAGLKWFHTKWFHI